MSIWKGKSGPLLVAEIGGNHEGDFQYAKKLAMLAIESGVDYVKFQIYKGDTLVNSTESPSRNKHFKKFELTKEEHISLAKICKENNVGYMASVWDIQSIEWIDPYLDIYKIGSGDLTAYPILREIAKKKKPIILSTGLAFKEEVLDTIEYLKKCEHIYTNPDYLALLQCTAMYPIPLEDANLKVIADLKNELGLAVGYSDHTQGSIALITAVSIGADILEFHFTDTREGKEFRDHKVSLTKDEVIDLKKKVNELLVLLGKSEKKPLKIEKDYRISFRRAIYPALNLPKGTVIRDDHLVCLRPNHGIDAHDYDKLIGKTSLQDLEKHQKLNWGLFK